MSAYHLLYVMKTYITLLAALPLVAFVAADWQRFSVDEQISVTLPVQPTEVDLSKTLPPEKLKDTKVLVCKDSYGTYQIIKSGTGIAIEGAGSEESRQSFNEGMISSLLKNQQGTLISTTPFKTSAGDGIEIKFKGVTRATGKRVIKVTRSLLIGSVSYSFNFIPADQADSTGTSGNEQRQQFFNSIEVKTSRISEK